MIEFLLVIIGFCLYKSYKVFQSIIAPPVLFNLGFFLCAFNAYFWKDEWDLQLMGWNTFAVIVSGVVGFTLICCFYDKIFNISKSNKHVDFYLKTWQLFFILFVVVVYYWLYIKAIRITTMESDFSEAVRAFDHANKFEEDSDYTIPSYISRLGKIVFCISYIVPYFAARFFLDKSKCKKIDYILYLFILLACIVGPLFSGGRAGAIKIVIVIIVSFYYVYKQKYSWKSTIPHKIFVYLIAGAITFALSFSYLGELLGRKGLAEKGYGIDYYLAIYCGAQIKNLDIYLNSSVPAHSNILGYNTFIGFHKYFNTTGTNGNMILDLPFQVYGNYPLGNVYTCFYQYIYDFGYGGLTLTIFYALFISFIWYRFRYSSDNKGVFYFVLYCYFTHPLLFSFFSNEFYQRLVSIQFVWLVILSFVFISVVRKFNK